MGGTGRGDGNCVGVGKRGLGRGFLATGCGGFWRNGGKVEKNFRLGAP